MNIVDLVVGLDIGADARRVLERAELRSVELTPSKDGRININLLGHVECETGGIEITGSFTVDAEKSQ